MLQRMPELSIRIQKNPPFIAYYQTLMPQGRFLDSHKPDKYGPRGF